MRNRLIYTMVVCLVGVLCSTGRANIDGISLASTSCEVNGFADAMVDGELTQLTYFDSDPLLATGSVASTFGAAQSSAEPFNLYAATIGGGYSYGAAAASRVVFDPGVGYTQLLAVINVDYGWSGGPELAFSYQLTDLTGNFIVDSFDQSAAQFDLQITSGTYEHTTAHSIDPTHQYELYMSIFAGSLDGVVVHMDVLEYQTIPEPATMSLLGLGSLTLLRRRRPC